MEDKRDFLKFILELAIVVVITTFFFHEIVIPVQVDGQSMYPTLHDLDTGVVSAMNTGKDGIERFDVIVLQSDKLDKRIIKRVIGLPGETVVYKNERLYINGVYYEEKFLDKQYMEDAKKQYNSEYFTSDFEYILGEDEIFVLGDNRLKSADSRVLGPFKYDDIVGKKGFILYPFNNIKWIE